LKEGDGSKQKEKDASLRRVLLVLRENSSAQRRRYTLPSAPRNTLTEAGKELLSRPVLEPLSRMDRERTDDGEHAQQAPVRGAGALEKTPGFWPAAS
jgi:hypothetical protein